MRRYYTLGMSFWLSDEFIITDKAVASIMAAAEEQVGLLSGEMDDAEWEHHEDMDKEEP